MAYIGELISLGVSISLTACALASEVGTKRLGVHVMNVWRMGCAMLISAAFVWILLGKPFPVHAGAMTWMWLLLSGFVGYFLGDYCLFNSYLVIGSRYGQLFMTLAPAFSAIIAWFALDQTLGWKSILAICVTLIGIAISVLGHGEGRHKVSLQIPLKGVLYGIGAGLGQGVGLILSKIGINQYMADVPADILPGIKDFIPFSANLIRCMMGFLCFSIFLFVRHKEKEMKESVHDRKGLGAMMLAVLFGPFLGVGFSLMSLQYTAAGIASTLQALTPVLILLPSYWLFKQKITRQNVIGSIISVAGASLFFLL